MGLFPLTPDGVIFGGLAGIAYFLFFVILKLNQIIKQNNTIMETQADLIVSFKSGSADLDKVKAGVDYLAFVAAGIDKLSPELKTEGEAFFAKLAALAASAPVPPAVPAS